MVYSIHSRGLKLNIRLTPKASQNRFGGVEKTADGASHLKAYVTTVAENGKANKNLIKMLAKTLKIPAGSISVASGATNRNKVLMIEGNPQDLTQKIINWKQQTG